MRLKKFCDVFIQVKRRRVWGSRRKPSIVCGVWTWGTGHLGSAQSNTARTLPSNLFGLSDPLSLPLRLTTRISAPSCQHSLFSVKRKSWLRQTKLSDSDEQSSVLWALHGLSHLLGKTNLKYYAIISFTDKGNSLGPIRR